MLALRHLLAGGDSLAVNLGSGVGISVKDIVTAITRVTGCPVPLREMPRRAGDPPMLTADPSRAGRIFGFRTELSQIDTIIRDAAPWFGLQAVREDAHAIAV